MEATLKRKSSNFIISILDTFALRVGDKANIMHFKMLQIAWIKAEKIPIVCCTNLCTHILIHTYLYTHALIYTYTHIHTHTERDRDREMEREIYCVGWNR